MHCLGDLRGREAQSEGQLARLEGLQSHAGDDVLLHDGVGILRRDLLDLHAAAGRRHENRPRFGAVDDDPQVELAIDGQRLLDQQAMHFPALGAGLVRHQLHAQHAGGDLAGFLRRVGDLHPAALAAPAGMDLRLHHHGLGAGVEQAFGSGLGRFAGLHHLAAGYGHSILI